MPENRSKMNTYGLPQNAFVHGNRIRMVQAPNIYVTAPYLMREVHTIARSIVNGMPFQTKRRCTYIVIF
jgi:hypothetical protein